MGNVPSKMPTYRPTTPARAPRSVALLLIVLGIAGGEALWQAGARAPSGNWERAFLLSYTVAWLCYLIAATAVTRSSTLPRWITLWIVVTALVLRLVAAARVPELSTDSRRYLWDGKVLSAGFNPYRHTPRDPALRDLRDENWRRTPFRDVHTVYPPLGQLLFATVALTRTPHPTPFRWLFALIDVASVLVLLSLLHRTGRPPHCVIWYAWCPLAISESAAGAHIDALGVFLLLLSFDMYARARLAPGALALAASVMTKGFAALAVPFLTRRGGWRWLVWFCAGCLALLSPFLSAGWHLFDGLERFLGQWKANSSVFYLTDYLLAGITPAHYQITRALTTAALLVVVGLLLARRRAGVLETMGAAFAALGAHILLGAPVPPWYVLWVLPALCWWRFRPLILLSLTISLQHYAASAEPGLRHAYLWAGYAPVYALLLWEAVQQWRIRRPTVRQA